MNKLVSETNQKKVGEQVEWIIWIHMVMKEFLEWKTNQGQTNQSAYGNFVRHEVSLMMKWSVVMKVMRPACFSTPGK